MSLLLSGYNYKLCYIPGFKAPNADCLSRFPMKVEIAEPPKVGEILLLEQISYMLVKADDIRHWTDHDPVLAHVRTCILQGWHDKREDIKPYFDRRNELSVLNYCILWGNRVVIPPQGRERVMKELHDTHPGIVRMNNLA